MNNNTDLEVFIYTTIFLFIGFFVCFLLVIPSVVNRIRSECHQAFTNELNSVSIARIEHCHNVHSNWNEIVWMETSNDKNK